MTDVKKIIAFFLAILLLGSSVSCNFLPGIRKKERTLSAVSDGKTYTLTVPAAWIEMDGRLMGDALLETGNPEQEEYLFLMKEPKARLEMDLKKYTEIVEELAVRAIDSDAVSGEWETLTIGGMPAYCVPLSGIVRDVQVQYWIYTIESSDAYLRIVSWTLKNRTDGIGQIFRHTASSLTVAEQKK